MLDLNHKKMQAWTLGMDLLLEVYQICRQLPDSEKFNIISQMQRAALSITNNIAEGASRMSAGERRRFYEIARSSCVEVDNCFEAIIKLQLGDIPELKRVSSINESVFRLLSKMMTSLGGTS